MAAISQARFLCKTAVLIHGLLNNPGPLARRGFDQRSTTRLQELYDLVHVREAEQEAMRSRLKEKTREANQALGDLKRQVSRARKLVKIEFPQCGWREFGIEDEK